jgi:hypothetical protein
MSEKIKDEELKVLQQAVNHLNNIKVAFADASLQVAVYQNKIIESDREVGKILKDLAKTYGDDKRIDVSTGTLVPIEDKK